MVIIALSEFELSNILKTIYNIRIKIQADLTADEINDLKYAYDTLRGKTFTNNQAIVRSCR